MPTDRLDALLERLRLDAAAAPADVVGYETRDPLTAAQLVALWAMGIDFGTWYVERIEAGRARSAQIDVELVDVTSPTGSWRMLTPDEVDGRQALATLRAFGR